MIVAMGLWAGTDCPSYAIFGHRPETDITEGVYKRIPEIKIGQSINKYNNWHNFIIDIGDTSKNSVSFSYKTSLGKMQKIKKPVKLTLGKDYSYIKAIIIGNLPYSNYKGTNSISDNVVFVDNVMFTKNTP